MQDIQEIFNKIQATRKQIKDIKKMMKDALDGTQEYTEINEQMKILREKKKRVEQVIKETMSSELTKLEDLQIDLASDLEMMNDISLTKAMNGETITLKDEYDNEYEPIFAVKFKKVN